MLDWMELIPFSETRNYVQRVIENMAIYRAFDPAAAGILEQIRRELTPQVPDAPTAELYNLNVYADGGHFAPHKDTPRGSDMLGTLVVCLPSQFSNGASADQNFWFNPAAFALPAAGTFGNAPRNLIYNPGEQQWDLALFKNFNLGGTKKAPFRAEFFNFPNTTSFSAPNATIDATAGGQVTSTSNTQRTIQFALKYNF